MDIEIGEIVATVRSVDADSILSPKTMQQIVKAVLRAVREDHEHESRARAERRVTSGVNDEQAAEGHY